MIKKYGIFFVVLFVLGTSFGQKSRGMLVFKDGSNLNGFAGIVKGDKVKFKKESKSKKIIYSFSELDTLKIYYDEEPTIFVQVKVKENQELKIVELVKEGKNVCYYRAYSQGYSAPMMMNSGGVGPPIMASPGTFYNIDQSYVRKTNEKQVEYLGSSSWASKNFKKAASNFFYDCPKLVNKIANKEFRKRDLKEIIAFYENCEIEKQEL